MIACGIQKISDAQMKKLHKGLPVRVKAGSAHQVPLTPAQAKKLAKAKADNKGMILSIPPNSAMYHGGSVFSDLQNWYETNIPPQYRQPLESLVMAGYRDLGGSGMKGGSVFSDVKNWYETNIPPQYRQPLESLVLAGYRDLGGSGILKRKGGSVFGDMQHWYETNIPPQYRQPLEQLVMAGYRDLGGSGFLEDIGITNPIQQAADFTNFLGSINPSMLAIKGKGKRRGKGLFDDLVPAFNSLPEKFKQAENMLDRDLMSPLREGRPLFTLPDGRAPLSLDQWRKGDPFAMGAAGMHGRGTLAVLAKHPVAGRHRLVRHHMTGARRGRGMHGKGWKEDLEAFDAWTNSIGSKLTSIGRTVDPEGKLQRAGINAAVDYIDPTARVSRVAGETLGSIFGNQGSTPSAPSASAPSAVTDMVSYVPPAPAPQGKSKPKKPKGKKPRKQPIVTATELLPSEYDDSKVLTAYTQPLPVASISSAFEDQLPYQPVRWFGSGKSKSKAKGGALPKKPHMVKGSPAAKQHMAKLRAMRSGKQGGALYPAGY